MRYYLDPFGCVKNQVDAENMMLYLNNAGWSAAPVAEDADLVIINSCGFIESAKRESINAVLGWRSLFPNKKILLAGCLAQRYAKDLRESLPEADALFGVDDISQIVNVVNNIMGTGDWGLGTGEWGCGNAALGTGGKNDLSSRPLLSFPGSAYVKISEGCNNRCSYCAIPLIRGPLRCRTVPDIVQECKGLLARGVRELCIVGQDIGSYRSGDSGLPELLNAIAELEGNFWVRLLYIHPDHFPLPILDLMEKDTRFLPYFDIPFQHGSPAILCAMNRNDTMNRSGTMNRNDTTNRYGTVERYIALAETIRSRLPAAVIRTTFLLGFPGETDADFVCLLDFQAAIRPDWLGCFCYSREEDTPAYSMKGKVPKKIAEQRRQEVEQRQIPITEQSVDRFVGQTLDVLLEEQFSNAEGEDDKPDSTGGLWLGRLCCHAPEVDGAAVVINGSPELKPGDMVPCAVITRRGFDLEVMVV